MEELFCAALGVEEPWYIEGVEFNEEKKRLDIGLKYRRGSKFGVEIGEGTETVQCPVYDTIEKTWRHLNFFQHECYLHARVPRVETPDGRILMVLPPWSGKMMGFTLLFEALLVNLCKHMPVHQASKIAGVSDYKLWRMLDVYVSQARFGEDWSEVKAVGMDETSLKKGHKYITLFVDTAARKTLLVAEGKDHKTVQEFTESLENHCANPAQITDISCDMSPAFMKGVKENLPDAKITFDKFHILKIINEAVDAVRREEAKTNPILKTEKERTKREELEISTLNLKSMKALQMRETFQQIYFSDTLEDFTLRLRKWIGWVAECDLEPMEKVAQTIVNHWQGILNWQKSKLNNGILEGLLSIRERLIKVFIK
jgi:transposase